MLLKTDRATSFRDGAKIKQIFCLTSIFIVAALLGVVAYISFLAPPSGDTWGHIVSADNSTPLDLIRRYLHGYFYNNPRLGQLPLSFAGYGQWATSMVNTLSLALLLVSGFVVATGKLPAFHSLEDSFALVSIFAITVYAGWQVGQTIFYVPFSANYMFGFGLLLAFIAFVRVNPDGKLALVLSVPLGFLAGLTNEHTPPFFLGVGLIVLALHIFRIRVFNLRPLHYLAFSSLFVGYLALFFAPGQMRRYGASMDKNDGFLNLLTKFDSVYDRASGILFQHSVPFYLAAIAALLGAAVYSSRRSPSFFWAILMLAASFGIALTVMASPTIGQRLMFASYVALAISLTGAIYLLREIRWLYLPLGMTSVVASAIYLLAASDAYRTLHSAFLEHEAAISLAKSAGEKAPSFPPYDFQFRNHSEFVRNESFSSDPNHRLNRLRARIYGFDSFTFDEP